MSRLGTPDGGFLLRLARAAVEAGVRGERAPAAAALAGGAPPDCCAEARGVFVTLHRHGALRGCIGYIEGVRPLGEAVVENALSAAFRDPRFLPLTADELEGLSVEVSVLTPLRPVPGPAAIEVPRHGVVLSRDGRRAVFLPQVAAEQGWDRDTLLSQLALKAGLPRDAWRQGATFLVFEAQVFAEENR
jgi:AmmeMemoRadiSam system protein A